MELAVYLSSISSIFRRASEFALPKWAALLSETAGPWHTPSWFSVVSNRTSDGFSSNYYASNPILHPIEYSTYAWDSPFD
jgi:hypothetical protein